jgi:hypothetical protein
VPAGDLSMLAHTCAVRKLRRLVQGMVLAAAGSLLPHI